MPSSRWRGSCTYGREDPVGEQTVLKRAFAVVLLLTVAVLAPAERPTSRYKIIVSRDNPAASITRKDLSAMFLRRSTVWPDGSPVSPVDQVSTARMRDDFSREVHGRSAAAIRSYWRQLVFSGRGVPPVEKATDHEVIEYVRRRPGAVGYVSAGARTDEVKVLRIDP